MYIEWEENEKKKLKIKRMREMYLFLRNNNNGNDNLMVRYINNIYCNIMIIIIELVRSSMMPCL